MPKALVEKVLEGDKLSITRLLSEVESETPKGLQALDLIYPKTGKAHKIGITGAPGSGKSTLVAALVREMRQLEEKPKIAVIAVDPTSPFSGGAILGDRVRMLHVQHDPGVFIRSMATRGALGGLSERTEAFTQVFDAAGYDFILIETVGAGQSEVDVVNLAHTVIVVDTPDMGDDIQAIKAGILEIADLLVVNKADRPGVEGSVRNLQNMVNAGHGKEMNSFHHRFLTDKNQEKLDHLEQEDYWYPAVLKTVATENKGLPELAEKIVEHGRFLKEHGLWDLKNEIAMHEIIARNLRLRLYRNWLDGADKAKLQAILQEVLQKKISPNEAVQALLAL
ncbi:MAG: methylmalonyl Co-A mutase-associated GTPase MeaB [Anaerolineaceae bacterium]|nr:methylmalonyl Co-A mutase-associated GTPase MeaB [Anaerolineaceae bacterium]